MWTSVFFRVTMCPNAQHTDYSVSMGVITAFQILSSQTSSFHRAPLVYFPEADFSTLADVL